MASTQYIRDIQMTNTGDLVIDPTGDLAQADTDQTAQQDVIFYLYTDYGDFACYPGMGSQVDNFIGEPNTQANANLIQAEMLRALSYNGRFSSQSININMIPVAIDQVVAYLTIINTTLMTTSNLVFNFNYVQGLNLINN